MNIRALTRQSDDQSRNTNFAFGEMEENERRGGGRGGDEGQRDEDASPASFFRGMREWGKCDVNR